MNTYLDIYSMGAREYDPSLGRWLSADTIVPDPANPQSLNRYAYVRNNPLKYVDPTGHTEEPPPELPVLVQQAIDYFTALGWEVVGDPGLIHPNWNGADLVFTAADGSGRVLAVELKDVAGMVDLGTLGKSGGDYGGSIDRLARQSERLYNSSQDQLKLMCQTVSDAYKNGKLENALFTSSEKVSTKAQDIFKGVYRVSPDGKVSVDKNLEKVSALGVAWQAFKHWTVATGKTVQRTIIDPIIIWPNPMWVMEELHRQDPDNPAYFPYWRAGEPPIG